MLYNKRILNKPIHSLFKNGYQTRLFSHTNPISSTFIEKNKLVIEEWVKKIQSQRFQHKDDMIASPLNLLANTLNEPTIPYKRHVLPKKGTIIPATWHHIYFPHCVTEAQLAKDGYEAEFFPPFPFTKRMWAGATLTWKNPNTENNNNNNINKRFDFGDHHDHHHTYQDDYLCVGDTATMITYVDRCEFNSSSRLGDTVFVYINKDIYKHNDNSHHHHDHDHHNLELNKKIDHQDWIMREQRCLVYATDQAESTSFKSIPVKKKSQFSIQITPSPIQLFRYSALTFNAHMIHYDQQYTTSIEGHPACLVHGPLSSTWMISTLRTYLDTEYKYPLDLNIESFHYKCLSPLYVNQPFTIHGKQSTIDEKQFDLWITNHLDHLAVKGMVQLKKNMG
ncbi:unnamed protein product [Cunninghamella blakesleeana]